MNRRAITVESSGVTLAVVDSDGDAKPLLFVHATGMCAGVWNLVAEPLTAKRRCLAYDQRGHGDSSKPSDPDAYAWERLADDCLGLIRELGFDRVDAVGHSSGATALVLAAALAPDRFDRLVLIEPIISPQTDVPATPSSNPLADGAMRRRTVFESRRDVLDRLSSKAPYQSWDKDVLSDYVDCATIELAGERSRGRVELKCPRHIEAEMYKRATTHRGYEAMQELTCPTLVLCGDAGSPLPVAYWQHLASCAPDGELGILEDCGHFAPMEKPRLVADRVATFLSD